MYSSHLEACCVILVQGDTDWPNMLPPTALSLSEKSPKPISLAVLRGRKHVGGGGRGGGDEEEGGEEEMRGGRVKSRHLGSLIADLLVRKHKIFVPTAYQI